MPFLHLSEPQKSMKAFYHNRLASFGEWPIEFEKQESKPTPEALARAGFFYVKGDPKAKTNDIVVCHECQIYFEDLESDDDPIKSHIAESPACSSAIPKITGQTAPTVAGPGASNDNAAKEVQHISQSRKQGRGVVYLVHWNNGETEFLKYRSGLIPKEKVLKFHQDFPNELVGHGVMDSN